MDAQFIESLIADVEPDAEMEAGEALDAEAEEKRRELYERLRKNEVVLSYSSFHEFTKSPRHFITYKMREKKQTPAMCFGQAAHCYILEPDNFERQFAVSPKFDRRTKAGKAASEDFLSSAGDKLVISEAEFANIEYLKKCLYSNESSKFVLEQITKTEFDIDWEYKGLKWHGRMDGAGEQVLCDLKFVTDASPRKIERAIKFEGYGEQAVHYQRGAKMPNSQYYLIACDRSGAISVHLLTGGFLHIVSQEIDHYISHFKRCQFLDAWNQSFDFFAPNGIYEVRAW